jgi:hypothetical protein
VNIKLSALSLKYKIMAEASALDSAHGPQLLKREALFVIIGVIASAVKLEYLSIIF